MADADDVGLRLVGEPGELLVRAVGQQVLVDLARAAVREQHAHAVVARSRMLVGQRREPRVVVVVERARP